ncbi:MAG TPA: hypothetical protein VEV61_06360 [Streptosporangiaceae bacterium]|nr:hypothetical protein [Streptosporangiaceae bacterium]
MALRDAMLKSSAQYLEPGETVDAVFGAQTTSQYLYVLTGGLIFLIINRYRIGVVTQQRILILDAGKMGMRKARGVVAELPRSTQLGPASGIWHIIPANGEDLHVHRRFFKDLATADAATPAISS